MDQARKGTRRKVICASDLAVHIIVFMHEQPKLGFSSSVIKLAVTSGYISISDIYK